MTRNIHEAQQVLNRWYRISVPEALLEELVSAEPELRREVEAGCSADTIIRECLLDAVCQRVTGGRHWPIGATPKDEADETFRIFGENAEKHGVDIWPDEDET